MKKKKDIFCLAAIITAMVIIAYSPVIAADRVVVVPLGGAVGNATVSDVVKGKTFSSKAGKGLTGTLELHPCGQSYTNSIGMTFNLLPSGTFTMGSPDGTGSEPAEPGRSSTETQHQVTLTRSFYLQTTEVTNKQWNTIIFDTGLGAKPSQSHTGDNYPVETVNWFEAAYFANRLSLVDGFTRCYSLNNCNAFVPGAGMACDSVDIINSCTGYRLPTEAEWEYAARAGTTTAYGNPHSFDTSSDGTTTLDEFNSNLHVMGWYSYNRLALPYGEGTKPVAVKQANSWGLYDMHGNLAEWCQDWVEINSAYPPDPVSDPTGDVTGSFRMYRGGWWKMGASYARSASRHVKSPDGTSDFRGFRLLLHAGR